MNPFVTLTGQIIRLEPLSERHADGLVAAAAGGGEFYRWSAVPQTEDAVERYIRTASSWREQGMAMPFAMLRAEDGAIVGSTRFWQLECWPWPTGHARHGGHVPDVGEIGYTWFAPSAIRSGANIEAKLMMLGYAFEDWKAIRICFHADARNERSIRALTKLGATREGVLRAHRFAVDQMPRDSVRFSILAEDWPSIKDRLIYRLTHHSGMV